MKAEKLLDKHAKKHMIRWSQSEFKDTHSKLHKTIIWAINEALQIHDVSPCYLLSTQDNFYKPLFLFKTYNEAREYAILMNYEFYTIDEVHYNKG